MIKQRTQISCHANLEIRVERNEVEVAQQVALGLGANRLLRGVVLRLIEFLPTATKVSWRREVAK